MPTVAHVSAGLWKAGRRLNLLNNFICIFCCSSPAWWVNYFPRRPSTKNYYFVFTGPVQLSWCIIYPLTSFRCVVNYLRHRVIALARTVNRVCWSKKSKPQILLAIGYLCFIYMNRCLRVPELCACGITRPNWTFFLQKPIRVGWSRPCCSNLKLFTGANTDPLEGLFGMC